MRPCDKKKILFYYEGLKDPKEPYAGTNAILFNLAKRLNGGRSGFQVEMMGDFIQTEAVLHGVKIWPTPQGEELAHALSVYGIVVFATHINQFRHCDKPAGQTWLLYQHCWKIEPRELRLIHLFDGVICLSALHRAEVIRQGVKPEIVDVFPNAIDTEFFRPVESVQRRAHSIVFAGAIVPYKGLGILLGAFNRVLSAYPDARLDIYGNAKMWNTGNEYEQELRYLDCPSARYHGAAHNSRMPEIYSSHSILCLPSVMESFSLVSIEAQACGCVPVIHNTGGVSVSVKNSQTGFLYSPNTAEHLEEAIHMAFQRIDADPEIRNKCRKFICNTYDIDRNIDEFGKLLYRYAPSGAHVVAENARFDQNQLLTPQHKNSINYRDKTKCSRLVIKKEHKMQFEERVHQTIASIMERGETDVAEWMLDKYLIDFPGHASGHYEKAMLAHASGNSEAAGVHLNKAVELEPGNKLFLKCLGDFYHVSLNDAGEALRWYEKVLLLQSDDLDTLLTAAHLYVSIKRFDAARRYYQKVLEINPDHMEAKQILEHLNAKVSMPGMHNSIAALYDSACRQVQGGQKKDAVATLEKLLAMDAGNACAHNDIGVLYYELGEKECAFDHYEKAVSLMPGNAVFHKNLADFLWIERGDAETALIAYKNALNIDQQDVEALLGFATICLETGRTDDAREFIDCALSVEPHNQDAACLLEKINGAGADNSVAVDPNALYDQAKAKIAAGNQEGAIEDLNRLVQYSPGCAVAYNDLGVLYYQLGDKEKALEAYEKSVQLDSSETNALKNLADFYLLEQQRVEEAMRLYLNALERNPVDLECLLATGFICTVLKKNDDAADFYRRVIELDPYNRTATDALERIQSSGYERYAFSKAGQAV
jgi:tetratricopeptide (TPR) repeat protein